jgi:hypothetical protein
MKGRDKEKRSVLGLGGPSPDRELSKWRPSKAGQTRSQLNLWQPEKTADEQNTFAHSGSVARRDVTAAREANVSGAAVDSRDSSVEGVWRPSEAVKERLSSLARVRRRRRFALPCSVRSVASMVLFVIGVYVFVKLWTMPTGMDLHPALAVFGVALVLLLIAAIVNAVSRRRRTRDDEKSTLRL